MVRCICWTERSFNGNYNSPLWPSEFRPRFPYALVYGVWYLLIHKQQQHQWEGLLWATSAPATVSCRIALLLLWCVVIEFAPFFPWQSNRHRDPVCCCRNATPCTTPCTFPSHSLSIFLFRFSTVKHVIDSAEVKFNLRKVHQNSAKFVAMAWKCFCCCNHH